MYHSILQHPKIGSGCRKLCISTLQRFPFSPPQLQNNHRTFDSSIDLSLRWLETVLGSQMDDLVSLTKAQVPEYLVGSDFYNSLSADDEEEFSIPRKFLKPTVTVTSGAELAHLFHTMKFWGMMSLPSNIIKLLIFKSEVIPDCEEGPIKNVLFEFDAEFKLSQLHETLPICSMKKQRLDSAAQCGREDVLEYVIRVDGQVNTVVIKAAAEHGFFQLLQRVVGDFRHKTNQNPFSKVFTTTVASRGYAECLLYVLENGCKKEKFTCRAAAENGHLACLKVAREHGCAWNQGVVDAAVLNGHLECLVYAMEFSNTEKAADTASLAAEHDQLECLRYLLDHGVEPTRRMCNMACGCDSLACLQLLRARGAPWDVVTARKAAEHGSLACLRYLFEEGCKVDGSVALAAARAGSDQSLSLLLTMIPCVFVDGASVDAAAKRGHSACVQVLKNRNIILHERFVYDAFDHDDSVDSADEAEFATIGGGGGYNYELYIRTLFEAGYAIPQCAVKQAVVYGHEECLEYICTNKCCALTADLTSAAITWTCVTYSAAILEILHRHGCPWDEQTCTQAARVCNVEALAFAHEHGCPWSVDTSTAAIQRNGTACLQYTLDHGCPVDDGACELAARRGLHAMLQLLHEHGCALTLEACVAAATHKYTDCLTYAVTHGAPVDESVCAAAAAPSAAFELYMSLYANVDPLTTLQCAHDLGCPWDERTCAAAAADNCRLNCLQYAHENGCPWDATTTTAAIHRYGSKCLQYALAHGCPVVQDACTLAARRGDEDNLQRLHEHGCALTLETCVAAATNKSIGCLTYAVTHGAPLDVSVCLAAFADYEPVPGPRYYNSYNWAEPLEILQCARNLGCPWDKRVSQAAAASGDASCLRYCVENGCPIDKATMQKYNSL